MPGKKTKGIIRPIEVYPSEQWYNKRFGLDYSEEFMVNPIKRTEMAREAEYGLYNIFNDVGLGDENPKPVPIASGAYGHRFMSALFGSDIYYLKDQAPNAISLDVDFDYMEKLAIPDFEKATVIKRAVSEAEILRKHYGYCLGDINTGSPLNVAVSVFGTEFLMACSLEPDIAMHVLRVIAETEIKLYYEYMNIIEPAVYPRTNVHYGYGNCPAPMISPEQYRKVVLPVDKWFRSQVNSLNLHHCGVFDKYIDIYKELDPSTLDIGGGSDYSAIRKAFPDITYSLIINAPDLENKSVSQIDELVGNVVETAGPMEKISSMRVLDISADISDDNVRVIRTVNERI